MSQQVRKLKCRTRQRNSGRSAQTQALKTACERVVLQSRILRTSVRSVAVDDSQSGEVSFRSTERRAERKRNDQEQKIDRRAREQ